jgi:hypothetical protein
MCIIIDLKFLDSCFRRNYKEKNKVKKSFLEGDLEGLDNPRIIICFCTFSKRVLQCFFINSSCQVKFPPIFINNSRNFLTRNN